jgi:uncharacterized protein YqgV (UPF0045/DUF77 family)
MYYYDNTYDNKNSSLEKSKECATTERRVSTNGVNYSIKPNQTIVKARKLTKILSIIDLMFDLPQRISESLLACRLPNNKLKTSDL